MPLVSDSFKLVSEILPAAIAICTPKHEILWANSAHAARFGYFPEGSPAQNTLLFVHANDHEAFTRASLQLLADPSRRVSWDARVLGPAGSYHWVENTLSMRSGIGVVLYQHDIHERKIGELQQAGRAKDLAAANERLTEFAFAAAHDLREPLRAIGACTELLVRGAKVTASSRAVTELITSGVARMSALIDNMLSYATTGVQQSIAPVNLEDAVAQATQHLTPEIARTGARVVVGRLPTVVGDEAQFVRIFQNLIHNAIKYRGKQPIAIEITAEFAGGQWVVAVQDNGAGISAEHQADIFLPFKRLGNSEAPGSGLGLAITRKLIERTGGSIWVQSELGSGSRFLFSIPAPAGGASRAKSQGA